MRAKIVILMVLIVLFTIFVTQNTEVILVQVFFWQFHMSTIVLISITGLVGIIAGLIIAKLFDKPKAEPRERDKVENIQSEKLM